MALPSEIMSGIPARLATLGPRANASSVAGRIGISSGTMSGYLNGSIPTPGDRALKIDRAVCELEELAKLTAPLPIDFSQVRILSECIEGLKEGRLKIAVIKSDLRETHKSFVLRFTNGTYFTNRDKNNDVLSTINFLSAAKMTREVAEELIQILKERGYSCTALENKFGESDPAFELSQVWRDEHLTSETVSELSA